jgi:hypothetical protein
MSIRLLLMVCLVAMPVLAEQKQVVGDYVAHYNAQSTTELNPEVARRHGINRNPRLAMIMVTVQNKDGEAVAAAISGQARNLLGQSQPLDMREIREDTSIYYIGLFSISHRDTQVFELDIRPAASAAAFPLRFSQQFFVD